jgi:hypothetical protein
LQLQALGEKSTEVATEAQDIRHAPGRDDPESEPPGTIVASS